VLRVVKRSRSNDLSAEENALIESPPTKKYPYVLEQPRRFPSLVFFLSIVSEARVITSLKNPAQRIIQSLLTEI
jgi:hypothetical protein